MAAQTFSSIQQTVAIALTQQLGTNLTAFSPNFSAQLPLAISWAEDRIYTGVPLLAERQVAAVVGATSPGSRLISLASMSPLPKVVEQVSLVSGGNYLTDDLGNTITDDLGNPITTDLPAMPVSVPYDPASLDFVYRVWPLAKATVQPSLSWQGGRYWAMQDMQTIAIAPTPDAVYDASLVVLAQPAGLSATNTSTWLSQMYPDALISGALVYLAGALTRNFGAQSDEPRQAVSWSTQFEGWIVTIRDEERRRRGLAPDFPQPPQPEAARQAQ